MSDPQVIEKERPAEVDERARVLIVDDEPALARMLARLLDRRGYSCQTASDVEEARILLEHNEFSLLLTDMNMPGDSGLDLLVEVRTRWPDVASIMITGIDNANLAEMALRFGAYGYMIKPFEPNEVLINVSNALRRRALEIDKRDQMALLDRMVKDRTDELHISRAETIERLAIAAEYRDDTTARHIHRMSRISELLAVKLGHDDEFCEALGMASPLHDVGKIGIPDSILLKPGKLTADEFEVIKKHADIGHRILSGSQSQILKLAASIALTHHEHFDGSGYPGGLKGEDIPIEGRIAAVADVFDALTSDRVYRSALSIQEAEAIMRKGRGTHFDPKILDLLLASLDEIVQLQED